ncbi:MAG: peptidylprolyl isomerase [Elusimicrobiota bacterium]|nr:peptidylprolyl isomerase [Elusimicrobiota bacterium]
MMTAIAFLALASAHAAPDFGDLRRMARAQDPRDLASVKSVLSADDPALRGEAAWALGQLGLAETPDGGPEPETLKAAREDAAAALLPLTGDLDAGVRALAVEALGKSGGAGNEADLRAAATDADARVRAEAALALFRLRQLKRVPEYSTAAVSVLLSLAEDKDPEVRWRAVYAFSRWPEPRAAEVLARAQRAADGRERLFAARALGKLGVAPDAALLADPDPSTRAEAVAAYGAAKAADRLPAAVFGDESAHARAAAADAAALSRSSAPAVLEALETMAEKDSPMPRGRALIALAALRGSSETARLARAREDARPWVRARAYEATALLPDAGPLLQKGLADPDMGVASAALEAILRSTGPFADGVLAGVLRDPAAPLELLGTAADAAAEREPIPVDALLDALRGAAPGLTAEVRGSIRKALKAAAAADATKADAVKAALERYPEKTDKPRKYKRLDAPATVILKTEKGEVELALDDIEAPNHAASVVDSVRRGLYEGTTWHRVVTAFVVQGGDPRGTGWGDDGWRLADEIGRRRFIRGTLGMPKAGKDTGGCQLFVSLVPTPHLDGRYTAFGQVTAGLDVLDRLEPGDKILSARLK